MSNEQIQENKVADEKKEALANELELLIRDMNDAFVEWRSLCGRDGWYSMPTKSSKEFFKQYIISAAKKAINKYKQ